MNSTSKLHRLDSTTTFIECCRTLVFDSSTEAVRDERVFFFNRATEAPQIDSFIDRKKLVNTTYRTKRKIVQTNEKRTVLYVMMYSIRNEIPFHCPHVYCFARKTISSN